MGISSRIVSRKIFIMSIYEQLISAKMSEQEDPYNFQLFEDVSQAMIHMVYMAERFFTNEDKTKAQVNDMIDIAYLKPLLS